MSLKTKKSTLETYKERNGSMDNGTTPVSLRHLKEVSGDKTPAAVVFPEDEKKRQRSSLKKIKKFLEIHSKKRRAPDSSPMTEQLTIPPLPKKHNSMKKSSSSSLNGAKECTAVKTNKSMPLSSLKQKPTINQNATRIPTSESGPNGHPCYPSISHMSDNEANTIPLKRQRLSVTNDSVLPNTEQRSSTEKMIHDLSWWSPSLNSLHLNHVSHDSEEEGSQLFESLIKPVTVSKFFKEIWEKKPLLVRRHNAEYNDSWFSTAELDQFLRQEKIMFGENIDVVTYTNGKRDTHNPPGRAYPSIVWDFFQQGCSIRLLNPQTYSKNVWKMLSMLQEYFGCMAGANVYLTPAGTQGFAPHYDDIEAFILQLEGKKRWRIYEPRNELEVLPRFSSPNFTDADLPKPVLDTVLEAGDLLYFPRGYIHQGSAMEDIHSLHLTVSVGQKNTWGDLLEKLIPRALEVAVEEDVDFRRSLPHDYLNYMGVAFSDQNNPGRQKFLYTIERLMTKLLTYAPVDGACDQMAKKFLEDSLPPVLSEEEEKLSISGSGEKWDAKNQRVVDIVELEPDTAIKIIRRGCLRLVSEEKVFIYHNLENARVYHGSQSQCIEVEPDEAEAVEFLLKSYPEYVKIESLPLETLEKQLELSNTLYERGLLMTRHPLETVDDEDESCESCDE